MRRTSRGTATALVAFVLLGAAGCSAHATGTSQAAAVASASSTESSEKPSAATKHLTEAAFVEDADGARLVLSADAPLLYTAYDPRPNLLVVDLPGVALAPAFTPPAPGEGLVQSIHVEPLTELGKSLTRVTVAYREGAHYEIHSAGEGLAVAFEVPGASTASVESAPPAAVTAQNSAPSSPSPSPEPSNAAAMAAAEGPVRGELAHALEDVVVDSSRGVVTVKLLGDGVFEAKDFALENPPRVVVDLPGVRNEVRRRAIPVKGDLVTRVRIAQFQKEPRLVARVVVDLARPVPYAVRADGERLALLIGEGPALADAAAVLTAPAPAAKPAPAPAPEPEKAIVADKPAEAPSRTVLAEPPAPEPAPVQAEVSASSASPVVAPQPMPVAENAAVFETKVVEPPTPAPATPVAAAPAPAAPSATEAASQSVASAAPSSAAPNTSRKTSAPAPLPPGVRKAQKSPVPASSTQAQAARSKTRKDDALFEAAAAVLDEQQGGKPPEAQPGATFQSRTIAESQGQFTGEPISLDLKDADIKDVFRTISQLTGLNIVIDPEVRGTVTVQLEDVPWDQALDLILKQNSLGYVLENNIMRIATSAKLQAEQADRARLAEARQAAEPTRTVIKKLSYAKANDVTNVVKSVMSRRGDIVVDGRTNTLIIREIATYLPAVLQLIENLDTPTPQVMIESRIVETTKSLGRSLGINWGFNQNADVAHGNTTGLVFPNSVNSTFRVPLDAGSTIGTIRMANILDSFNLDIALTAAENQGLLKIISSPKVTALTNTAASIQSGTQIPVQTNVNNTTTVIYVDATLKLTVTPQITAEGTVLLDVDVAKREPAVALNLSLGQNVPITVRQYKGQILVRDGGTTVIGGIFQLNDQDQNNMIPGLWKIPIFGNLFRNKTRTEKHDELLIFITPRILRS
jgi:type IV pilus assembly protein PilQ